MTDHRTLLSRRAFAATMPAALVAAAPEGPRVLAEETIYDYVPANNGAGPLWAFGAPGIVRRGDAVYATGLDTIPDAKPLNNCRWAIHHRRDGKWERAVSDDKGRQREPCPIGMFDDGRLILSVNPTLTAPDAYNGPSDPHLLAFPDLSKPPAVLRPVWSGQPRLTEHTYRGMGIDGRNRELLVLHNDGSGKPRAHWAFLDRAGSWRSNGVIEYPIRGCYPQVALRGGTAHVLAAGDIVEPVAEWRKWKFEQTRREWDYVFRRLYYVRNANVASEQFAEPLEVANVDATAGHIRNLDLWVGPDGAAHLLYLQRRVASRAMRDRFFPGVPLTVSLEHCIVRNGRVASRRSLISTEEEPGSETPEYARLHAVSRDRLVALVSMRAESRLRMRVVDVWPEYGGPKGAPLNLEHPMGNFITATERGGSNPSPLLDVVGTATGTANTIRYALLRL